MASPHAQTFDPIGTGDHKPCEPLCLTGVLLCNDPRELALIHVSAMTASGSAGELFPAGFDQMSVREITETLAQTLMARAHISGPQPVLDMTAGILERRLVGDMAVKAAA